MKNLLIFTLLVSAAWSQRTQVTVEENQTISGNKTYTGTTTIGPLCRSSLGDIDVVACYGADPTGKNDSTAALNSAFSNSSHATRYIPAGTYKISNTLDIDTRYKVQGVPNRTFIVPTPEFNGTMAHIVSKAKQPSVVLGGMDGLAFNGQGHAAIGIVYGGPDRNVSTYGYQTSNTVMHGFQTAGAQIADEAWELVFINVGFQGNGGIGLELLDGFNMGENINCHGCDISNNNIGVAMRASTRGFTHHFSCYGCSFDYNTTWGVQNQTATSGESIISIFGGQFETIGAEQRWIQNHGRMDLDGVVLLEDTSKSYPSYLIDNENFLAMIGGRQAPNAVHAIFNPAQTGHTSCIATIGAQAMCSSFIDPYGNTNGLNNLILTGYLSANRLQQPAANTYAGKCQMSGGTSCTFTTSSSIRNYVSYVSLDQASRLPQTAISAKCSLSGTTATITAGAPNSLTWDCIFVGNPF